MRRPPAITVRRGASGEPPTTARTGATLLELVVSLTLMVIVVSLSTGVLQVQRHALSGVAGDARAQTVLRHAAAPLTAHLRLLEPLAGTMLLTDSVVDGFSTFGEGVVCAHADDPARLLVVPRVAGTDGALPLTGWRVRPDQGDVALILAAGSPDRRWIRGVVAAVDEPAAGRPCDVAGESPASGGAPAVVVRLVAAPERATPPGTAISFARRVRYSIYRTGDGSWALGHRRCSSDPTLSCQGVQPVAGPLRPLGDRAHSGLHLEPAGAGDASGSIPTGAHLVLRAPRTTPAGLRTSRRTATLSASGRTGHDSLALWVAARSLP